jgi:hypothetical protein
VLLTALLAGLAPAATPDVNSAVIRTRIFNDCPSSILTTVNNYPSYIMISDADLSCYGYANLHNWRFSDDGVNPAVFNNDSEFAFEAWLVISGTAEGEAGLQISPWWSQDVDGRLNVRTTDGEIACFGGRLPFYTFTGVYGLRYMKGTPIHLGMVYHPNGLSEEDPGTIEYLVEYQGTPYSSGVLPFDQGNPGEPYGLWGILDDARAGAHVQTFMQPGMPDMYLTAEWMDIVFTPLGPTATEHTTWGSLKSLYQ